MSDDKLFHGDECEVARVEAAKNFLHKQLRIQDGEVKVISAWMSNSGYNQIMWLTMSKRIEVGIIFNRQGKKERY